MDKQLIMMRMGHRSTDEVRAYKWVSEMQQQPLSNVLNRTCDHDATSEPPQKKQKIADGQENVVSTDSTPSGVSTGEYTQQGLKRSCTQRNPDLVVVCISLAVTT